LSYYLAFRPVAFGQFAGLNAVNIINRVWLKIRFIWRARTFEEGRKMGMTKEEARTYTDDMHPLTPVEAAYEEELRQKNKI